MSQFAEFANTTVGIGVCGNIRERITGCHARFVAWMIAIDDRVFQTVQPSRATEWLFSNGKHLLMLY